MSETISPDMKVLMFHAVLNDPEEFTPSKFAKTTNPEIVELLEKSRLMSWRKKGRSLYLSANDATWRWVEEHLADELPHRAHCTLLLLQLRAGLAAFLKARNLRLADVLAPAPAAAAEPFAMVREACLALTQGRFDTRVRLKDLRAALGGLTRAQQDETLLAMQSEGRLAIYPNDDPQDRTPEDEAAAMVLADRHRDLVFLHPEQRS